MLWKRNAMGNILLLVLGEDEFDDTVSPFPLLILSFPWKPSGITLEILCATKLETERPIWPAVNCVASGYRSKSGWHCNKDTGSLLSEWILTSYLTNHLCLSFLLVKRYKVAPHSAAGENQMNSCLLSGKVAAPHKSPGSFTLYGGTVPMDLHHKRHGLSLPPKNSKKESCQLSVVPCVNSTNNNKISEN